LFSKMSRINHSAMIDDDLRVEDSIGADSNVVKVAADLARVAVVVLAGAADADAAAAAMARS
jgi:hypothetical protein